MALRRVHLWIRGDVQGVGFRQHTRMRATALGLAGWVRNTAGGQVEVVAEGEEGVLQMLVEWCQHGPPSADVVGVEVRWEPYQGEFGRFQITW